MSQFNYKSRQLLKGQHLIGTLLVLAGVANMVIPLFVESDLTQNQSLLIGAVVIIVGLGIVFTYDGILIDFEQRRVKDYASLCGFKKGEWRALPSTLGIEVMVKEEQSTNTANGISPTLSTLTVTYEVILKNTATQKAETVLSYSKEKQAQQIASVLRNHLN